MSIISPFYVLMHLLIFVQLKQELIKVHALLRKMDGKTIASLFVRRRFMLMDTVSNSFTACKK